jgi:hypothetical protein
VFQRAELEAFVLGECAEDVAAAIEERLFSDDGFYEKLRETKKSLILREVEGRLPLRLSRQLALQAERSPLLREEIAEARASHERLEVSRWGRKTSGWRPVFAVAVAVVLLAVFFGVRLNKQRTLLGKAADPPRLAQVRTQDAGVSFFLPAMVLRDAPDGAVGPVLRLSDDRRPVELQVEVPVGGVTVWSVQVSGKSVPLLRLDGLPVKAEGPLRYVAVSLPAGALKPGEYRIVLRPNGGASPTSEGREIVKSFRVVLSR